MQRGSRRALSSFARPARLLLAVSSLVAFAVAASGGTSTGSTASAASAVPPLTVADVAPFSGVDAALGPAYLAACAAATNAINSSGGVLGHRLGCKAVDTQGSTGAAVAAVRKMYASTPNLVLVIGCSADEAAGVVPVFAAKKTVAFCTSAQSAFNRARLPYFYRLVPPDVAEAYAMVVIAHDIKHYKRVALAFANDSKSQALVAPAIAAIKKAGETLVANRSLNLRSTTFRPEAASIVGSRPDVILTAAPGPPEAAFLSAVKKDNAGRMIPIVTTSAAISADWYTAVAVAVGASTLASNFLADSLAVERSGPAYRLFAKALLAEKGRVGDTANFLTYLTAPGVVHLYDAVNLAALAMIAARSSAPSVYNAEIPRIANGVAGATVVASFAQGAAALKQGKQIRYEGPGGPTSFDAYHDSVGILQVDRFTSTGNVAVTATLSTSALRALGL